MEIEKLTRLHTYAAVLAALFFVAGVIRASFYDGDADVAIPVWLFGASVYLPFYVLYSEGTGSIYFPHASEARKADDVVVFRVVQALYLVVAVVCFMVAVGDLV